MYLTPDQEQAVDASPDVPPRVIDPTDRQAHVLLPSDDFDWMRGLLGDEPDTPRLLDRRNQRSYALVPLDRYERFKAFFEDDPITPAERQYLLREFGKRAGWDDPEMDVYDRRYPPGQP